jgi:hypothetical protein
MINLKKTIHQLQMTRYYRCDCMHGYYVAFKTNICPKCKTPDLEPFFCVYCDSNVCTGPESIHWSQSEIIPDQFRRGMPQVWDYRYVPPGSKPGWNERLGEAIKNVL